MSLKYLPLLLVVELVHCLRWIFGSKEITGYCGIRNEETGQCTAFDLHTTNVDWAKLTKEYPELQRLSIAQEAKEFKQ